MMKALKILTLIFTCLIVHVTKIYAQKDYVITINKDTIFCKIKQYGFNNRVKYRVNKDDKFIYVKDDSVIQYHYDKKDYILKEIPKEKDEAYVRFLERGRVSLYERIVPAGKDNTIPYWYANKENAPLVLIWCPGPGFLHVDDVGTEAERKKAFIDLFSDNPAWKDKFKSALEYSYDYDTIVGCIQKYNDTYKAANKVVK